MATTTQYQHIRRAIRSGDLMVLKNPGLIARHAGRGEASHVGTLAWRHDDQDTLLVGESREWVGARVVTLSSQVRKYPGQIDIYTPTEDCPRELRARMATLAVNWAGRSYSYAGILRRALVELPLAYELATRCGYEPVGMTDLLPSPWEEPKVCSGLALWLARWAKLELAGLDPGINQALCRAVLAEGWEPLPLLSDRWAAPNDLVGSAKYKLLAANLVV